MSDKEVYGSWKLSKVHHLYREFHNQNVTIDILWKAIDYKKFYKNKKIEKLY